MSREGTGCLWRWGRACARQSLLSLETHPPPFSPALGGARSVLHPLGIHASGFQMGSVHGRTRTLEESSLPFILQVSRVCTVLERPRLLSGAPDEPGRVPVTASSFPLPAAASLGPPPHPIWLSLHLAGTSATGLIGQRPLTARWSVPPISCGTLVDTGAASHMGDL